MVEIIILFLATAIISFAGSLQPGTVNVFVMQTSLAAGVKKGKLAAIGGSIPELIYSFLAIHATHLFSNSPFWEKNAGLISASVLLILGIGSLTGITHSETPVKKKISGNTFINALLLGLLNPLLLIFWTAMAAFFSSHGIPVDGTTLSGLAFISGAAIGGFCLLYLVSVLSSRWSSRLNGNGRLRLNRHIGILYLSLGIAGMIRLAL